MANDLLLPVVPVEVPPEGVSISRAAEITGVGIEALRYYERAGLMLGHTRRDSGGRRRYRQADLAWIGGLVMLRETGMSIADVRRAAELSRRAGTEGERLALLRRHRDRVVADLARTQRHLAKIEAKIAAYEAAERKS
jgi:DNA-binding transcriptional MerR regulator